MAYVYLSDLGQQAPAGTPENLMTRPEYDRLRELETAGVAHDQAKKMIYDARKTGSLPAVPQTTFGQRVAAQPFLFAGIAAGLGLLFGGGFVLGILRRDKAKPKSDSSEADKAIRAALGIPEKSVMDDAEMKTGVLTRN